MYSAAQKAGLQRGEGGEKGREKKKEEEMGEATYTHRNKDKSTSGHIRRRKKKRQ